jgi:hypothetical protein
MNAATPRLRHRLLRPEDSAEAIALLPAWLGLPDSTLARLPALWAALLHEPGFNADVIEDLARPPGQRLRAFGAAVALDERWSRRLAEQPPVCVARQLYAELLDGRFRPPGELALARANAEQGVEFLVLHYAQLDNGLDNPAAHGLWSMAMSAFRLAHAGHRIRQVYQEATGDSIEVLRSMGMQQRTARTASPGAAPLPELFGLARQEALRMLPGAHLRDVFEHREPLFGFSPAERRLLRRAVHDETDEEITGLLATSAHTLKKQWRSAQGRAALRLPELFGDSAERDGDGGRGPEKRRLLISYLRQHPEELRPYLATR